MPDANRPGSKGGDSERPESKEQRSADAVGRRNKESAIPSRAWEDDPRAWGESASDDDERFLNERPPHWD